MNARPLLTIACLGVVLSAVACKGAKKNEPAVVEKTGTSTITSSELRQSVDDASQSMAFAHCEREMSCSGLNSWTLQANKDECVARLKTETSKELSAESCPRGIDHANLVNCLAAIERTGCGDPIGGLIELQDCKKDKLCISANAP
jgi:hypothetical protein